MGLIELAGSNDPFVICDYLDIQVSFRDLGDKIYGFFQRTEDGIEILHINNTLDDHIKKYICAHELGHAILHEELCLFFLNENTFFSSGKFENQANKFAAELLIPDDIINEYPKEYTVQQIACCEYVPEYLVDLKFPKSFL